MVIKYRMMWQAGLLALVLFVLPCLGQGEQETTQTPDQKVTEAANRIGPALDAILTQVNESKPPERRDLSAGQSILDETKRYFLQMDDKAKAQYCLLQGWLAYFAGQIESAHLNAAKACKLDATSGDAWATQVAMAIVAGKKPMLPRPPKPARGQRGRQGQGTMEGPDMMRNPQEGAWQIQNGKLTFDLSQFMADALDKKIQPLQLNCLNGTTLGYEPGKEALCVLLWQKFETKRAAGSNEPNQRTAVAPDAMPMPPLREYGELDGGGIYGQSSAATPTAAFGRLFRTGIAGGGHVKFLSINLDTPANKQAVVEEILRQPQAWAQVVIANQTGSGMFGEFSGISPARPVLMITDTAGAIRYAGPATGFIAPMVLQQLIKSDLTETVPTEMKDSVMDMADSNSLSVVDSNSIVKPAPIQKSAPTSTIQKPVQNSTQQAQPAENQYKEMSEEDAIQAERKLTYARDLFMQIGKKPGLNYTRGVNLCREIIRQYPDTEYAQEAKKLLREIPEDQRARYKLTDKELEL